MDSPQRSTTLLHEIVARLRQDPAACALRFHGDSITNAALLHAVTQLAAWLRAAHVAQGTRVGVCLERSPAYLALLLALWARGAVYVPLDAALPRERLFAMCDVARVDLVITSEVLRPLAERLPCALRMLPCVDMDAAPQTEVPFQPACADDAALAYILFTSGSSGTPKGVQICHGNLKTLFAAVLPLLGLTRGCRILGCASFSFDIAFFELLAPLLCGGTLVLADETACTSPPALLELVADEAVNVVQATPSHWNLLVALPWPSSIELAIATGEALLRTTAAAALQHASVLWNLYGPTECTLWSSAQRVSEADLRDTAPAIVSIGRALPGYRLELSEPDEAGAGELLISGRGVSPGYCDATDAQVAFDPAHGAVERRYHSGDICRIDAAGLLHFLGRRDSQAKHNGYRIDLHEIEAALQQHMSVRRAACCVRPPSTTAPSLLSAFVEFRPGLPNRDKAALNRHLAATLPAWMLPQRYFFVDRLPQTASGKLDRAALLALAEQQRRPWQGDSLEAHVAAVFCEVLDLDAIGPCDSFLDMGGSSMLAATLILALNERLGASLTLRQALTTPPTVTSIVQLLRAAEASSLAS